jgi:hypothetical protein
MRDDDNAGDEAVEHILSRPQEAEGFNLMVPPPPPHGLAPAGSPPLLHCKSASRMTHVHVECAGALHHDVQEVICL